MYLAYLSSIHEMANTNLTRLITSGQAIASLVILDKYKSNTKSEATSIDNSLENVNCFQISSFNYIVGDCLFDTMHALLHCQYTCVELRNGLVDYFLQLLHHGSAIVANSFLHELHPSLLYDLHKVTDPTT